MEITTLRQDFRDNIFKLLNTKNLDNKALEIIEEEYFQTLTKQTLKSSGSTSENYRFLLNNTHERKLWNYQNSVFFAITFLTTIGNLKFVKRILFCGFWDRELKNLSSKSFFFIEKSNFLCGDCAVTSCTFAPIK